jgi:hypothetical protein
MRIVQKDFFMNIPVPTRDNQTMVHMTRAAMKKNKLSPCKTYFGTHLIAIWTKEKCSCRSDAIDIQADGFLFHRTAVLGKHAWHYGTPSRSREYPGAHKTGMSVKNALNRKNRLIVGPAVPK